MRTVITISQYLEDDETSWCIFSSDVNDEECDWCELHKYHYKTLENAINFVKFMMEMW